MRYLITILLFNSCVDVDFQIDSRLKPYFNQFVTDAKEHGVTIDQNNLIMKLKDLRSEKAVGLYSPAVVQKYIYIDSANFFKYPETVPLIIYHELGHAFLKRDHVESFSYMNPATTRSAKTDLEIEELNKELFK